MYQQRPNAPPTLYPQRRKRVALALAGKMGLLFGRWTLLEDGTVCESCHLLNLVPIIDSAPMLTSQTIQGGTTMSSVVLYAAPEHSIPIFCNFVPRCWVGAHPDYDSPAVCINRTNDQCVGADLTQACGCLTRQPFRALFNNGRLPAMAARAWRSAHRYAHGDLPMAVKQGQPRRTGRYA